MLKLKIIYKIDACYGTYFVGEKGELITYIQENDGEWQDHYFSPILTYLGGVIVRIKVPEMKIYSETDDYFEYFEQHLDDILEIIEKK